MGKLDLDFAALLVGLSAFTGAVWALDRLFFAKRRLAADPAAKEPVLVEYCRSFFPVIFAVLVIRSFLAEPFRIPSDSMMPTLMDGDFILVNKFAYGLRLPVANVKFVDIGEPQRGDVVVFRNPRKPAIDYIKRIIGLPGDRVTVRNRRLFINDQPMAIEPVGPYGGASRKMDYKAFTLLTEKLPPVDHRILLGPPPGFGGGPEGSWTVGPDEYFVMGDNRSNSEDSRVWGTVPVDNLVGKAFFVWLSWDHLNGGLEFDRMGTVIE
jgi:signal peptidase I